MNEVEMNKTLVEIKKALVVKQPTTYHLMLGNSILITMFTAVCYAARF